MLLGTMGKLGLDDRRVRLQEEQVEMVSAAFTLFASLVVDAARVAGLSADAVRTVEAQVPALSRQALETVDAQYDEKPAVRR